MSYLIEAKFEEEIDAWFLDYPITAEVTYRVYPGESKGYEIIIQDAVFKSYGVEMEIGGKSFSRLNDILEERAIEHYESREVA